MNTRKLVSIEPVCVQLLCRKNSNRLCDIVPYCISLLSNNQGPVVFNDRTTEFSVSLVVRYKS